MPTETASHEPPATTGPIAFTARFPGMGASTPPVAVADLQAFIDERIGENANEPSVVWVLRRLAQLADTGTTEFSIEPHSTSSHLYGGSEGAIVCTLVDRGAVRDAILARWHALGTERVSVTALHPVHSQRMMLQVIMDDGQQLSVRASIATPEEGYLSGGDHVTWIGGHVEWYSTLTFDGRPVLTDEDTFDTDSGEFGFAYSHRQGTLRYYRL